MTDATSTPEAAGAVAIKKESGKARVLYLNHVAQMSGGEQSLRALLWQFRRDGGDIEPIVALPGDGPFSQLLREEGWSVTFAPLRRLHRPQGFLDGMTSLVHILQTAPFLSKLARGLGAHLIHSNSTTAQLVGGLAAERLKIPAIWHARDLVSLARIAPSLSQKATLCIAISQAVAQQLKNDGVPEEKIRMVYNGLDPDEWRSHKEQTSRLRESLNLGEGTFLFGCASQLVPWKNHQAFIEAAARIAADEKCDHARFVIIGGDLWGEHQEYVKELRALVKKHDLQNRFNFVPNQSDNFDAISGLDAVVLPSREEPFGRVLIEAMALGKVAIAFDSTGPREIIAHEKDGLLAPLSVSDEGDDTTATEQQKLRDAEADALAHVMKRALWSESLRHEIGAEARRTVIEKFHIADSAQAVHAIYNEVLS
jgi:glycosyltransferase involved in cell wall biosynthesis